MFARKRNKVDYNVLLNEVMQEKELFDRESEIRDMKKQMRRWKPPTTTKILMSYIFLNCTVIEVYSMVVMWKLADLSALYALITAVVTESLSFAIYCAKAYNETKQEEIIRLERDRMLSNVEDSSQANFQRSEEIE